MIIPALICSTILLIVFTCISSIKNWLIPFLISIVLLFVSVLALLAVFDMVMDNNIKARALRNRLDNQIEAIYNAQKYTMDDDPIQLVNMIKEYNAEITTNQSLRQNKWFGVLTSKVYDEYKKINYEEILNERSK